MHILIFSLFLELFVVSTTCLWWHGAWLIEGRLKPRFLGHFICTSSESLQKRHPHFSLFFQLCVNMRLSYHMVQLNFDEFITQFQIFVFPWSMKTFILVGALDLEFITQSFKFDTKEVALRFNGPKRYLDNCFKFDIFFIYAKVSRLVFIVKQLILESFIFTFSCNTRLRYPRMPHYVWQGSPLSGLSKLSTLG